MKTCPTRTSTIKSLIVFFMVSCPGYNDKFEKNPTHLENQWLLLEDNPFNQKDRNNHSRLFYGIAILKDLPDPKSAWKYLGGSYFQEICWGDLATLTNHGPYRKCCLLIYWKVFQNNAFAEILWAADSGK